MKKSTRNRIWAACILAGFLGACALPMSSTPTQPFLFPTPNLTMTALFQIPPTATTAPVATALQATAMSVTPTYSPTVLNCTNLAQFVTETYPDLTYVAPGTAFIKTWTLKNIGTCTWGAGYALVFDSGDQMGGPATVPLTTASVPPNALYTFSVNLTAPATAGQFQGFWKLQTPQGVRFGINATNPAIWVKITTVVLAPACNAQSQRPSANGSLVEAYQTGGTAPSINWTLVGGEWTIPLIYSANNVVFGTSENTATYTMKWDSENLYVVVIVADSVFYQETGGGATMYKGDSFEILLDTNLKGDYCDTGMSSDDYQLGISPGSGATVPAAYLWYPLAKAGSKVITGSAHIIPSGGWIASPVGWIMIAKIPWNIFGVTPAGGEYYGFAFSVTDDDHAGLNQTDGMISSDPKRTYPSNPAIWGTLEIEVKTGP